MMFVGDSLNRGQYVSMVCLLHSLIPDHSKSMETFDSLTVFTAKVRMIMRYRCSLPLMLKGSLLNIPITSKIESLKTYYIHLLGVQRDDRVLLGAVSFGIELG